jgi:hypothetical protein
LLISSIRADSLRLVSAICASAALVNSAWVVDTMLARWRP